VVTPTSGLGIEVVRIAEPCSPLLSRAAGIRQALCSATSACSSSPPKYSTGVIVTVRAVISASSSEATLIPVAVTVAMAMVTAVRAAVAMEAAAATGAE
jgi:hypothetical protein